jgi:hypothetical protein
MSRCFGNTGRRGVRLPRVSALWFGILVLLLMGVASCAKPPEMEIQAAQAALDQAKVKEATEYASAEYRAAADSLTAANAEIDRQKAKFALFRSYKNATQKALSAKTAAEQAATAAVRNKELARQEAEAALATAVQEIADTRALIDSDLGKRLMRAKEAKQALTQIVADLDAAEATLANVREGIGNERYRVATSMGNEAVAKVQQLRSEVQTAIDKMTGARK